jgi:hypothetical protein
MKFIIAYGMFAMRDTYSALPDFKFETISKKTNEDTVFHVHTTRPLKFVCASNEKDLQSTSRNWRVIISCIYLVNDEIYSR